MTAALDDQYLTWLYSQVGDVKDQNRSHTYWNLLSQLDHIAFVYLVPNDDNRAEDGRALRQEWMEEKRISLESDWRGRGCSFLEMLIGLCRRLAFEADGHVDVWFWHLINNLGLSDCTDRYPYDHAEVDARIHAVIYREYDRNGHGGLFPMRRGFKDQRHVEIWYQMNAYLLEG